MKFDIPAEWCERKAKEEDEGATIPIRPHLFAEWVARALSKRNDELKAALGEGEGE